MSNDSLNITTGSPEFFNKNKPIDTALTNQSGKATTPDNVAFKADQITISQSSDSLITYSNSMTLEGTRNDGYDLLRGLVLNIFKEQGLDAKIALGSEEINLETLTLEEAQELVAEDGYFGVEKTSERIFDLAVGIAGGDPGRVDAVREGVEKGFQEALKTFGGELPEISHQTYDAVMKKLDDWAGVETSPETKI